MMSYLWILLLGILLATHAKAQDDESTEAEEAATDLALLGEVAEPTPLDDGTMAPELETVERSLEEAEMTPASTETVEDAGGEAETADSIEGYAETGEETADPAEVDAGAATPTTGDSDAVTADAEGATEEDDTADIGGEVTIVAPGDPEPVTPAADPEPDAATTAVVDEETEQPPGETVEGTTEGIYEETGTDDSIPAAVEEKVPPPKTNPDVRSEPGNRGKKDHPDSPPKPRSGMHNVPDTAESESPKARQSTPGSLAGILSAIVVAAVGAVTGYFAYQKKKLCFKNRQQADPEAAHKADAAEAQADPQVLSTLLDSTKNQQ